MLAFSYKYSDAFNGCVFKRYSIVDFSSPYHVKQVRAFDVHKDENLTIDEVRFKSGISEIYELIDVKSWERYYDCITNQKEDLRKFDDKLSRDDQVLKDIANFDNDLRAFRIWKAAQQWKASAADFAGYEDTYLKSLNEKK